MCMGTWSRISLRRCGSIRPDGARKTYAASYAPRHAPALGEDCLQRIRRADRPHLLGQVRPAELPLVLRHRAAADGPGALAREQTAGEHDAPGCGTAGGGLEHRLLFPPADRPELDRAGGLYVRRESVPAAPRAVAVSRCSAGASGLARLP